MQVSLYHFYLTFSNNNELSVTSFACSLYQKICLNTQLFAPFLESVC